MYEGPEFSHLVAFVAVAEECSFTAAAKRIRVAQPSLSSQIKHIEEGIGAALFIRSQTTLCVLQPPTRPERNCPYASVTPHLRIIGSSKKRITLICS